MVINKTSERLQLTKLVISEFFASLEVIRN